MFGKCVFTTANCVGGLQSIVECVMTTAKRSLARQPQAGKKGLDELCYSSCANAKTLAGPIRFVDCYTTSFPVDKLQDLLH